MDDVANSKVATFETGAVRSTDADDFRFDLISPIGLQRLAATYAEGARKYKAHNYLKGFPASTIINHVERHLALYKAGDRSEDHIGHATWGLFTLMHFEETRPELMDMPPYAEFSKTEMFKTQFEIKPHDK